jgi:aspartate/methionine/tyrosine aminotransferase
LYFHQKFLSLPVFEPAYDSYVSQIKMGGGTPVPVVLELDPEAKTSAGYVLDMDAVRAKVTDKTKMMVINK